MYMGLSPFPTINAADEGTRRDRSYRWDNNARPQSDCCVLQCTLEGEVEFTFDGVRSRVPAGHAFLCTHQEASIYQYPENARAPYRFRFVAFFPGAAKPFFNLVRSEFGSIVVMSDHGEAFRMLRDIVEHTRGRRFLDGAHLTESILRLLLAIYREQVVRTKKEDPIAYGYYLLNDQANHQLSVKEVARLAGVSREYFAREYGRRYQDRPGTVLRRLRLDRARRLVLSTHEPLDAIAAACGFGSADALRRSFRRRFGQNPLSLRRTSGPIERDNREHPFTPARNRRPASRPETHPGGVA